MGDRKGEALILHNLGLIAQVQGKYPRAFELYEQSLSIKEELGSELGKANTLHQMGMIAHVIGDNSRAMAFTQVSYQIRRERNDQSGIRDSLLQLGARLPLPRASMKRAEQYYSESLQVGHKLGNQRAIAVGTPPTRNTRT